MAVVITEIVEGMPEVEPDQLDELADIMRSIKRDPSECFESPRDRAAALAGLLIKYLTKQEEEDEEAFIDQDKSELRIRP